MAPRLQLYLFGDQAFDVSPYLKALSATRADLALQDFLVKSYEALRMEIYTLPRDERESLPRFTCIDDILRWDHSGRRCIPLGMAITCLYHMAILMSEEEFWDPHPDGYRVFGLCTGAIAAAAGTCSRSRLDLVAKAVIAVRVAFRVGMLMADFAKRVASSPDLDQTWSIIVQGSAAPGAVDEFCQNTQLPAIKKPYISAYMQGSITVSGPPSSLNELTNSVAFEQLKHKSIPIYGPYHA